MCTVPLELQLPTCAAVVLGESEGVAKLAAHAGKSCTTPDPMLGRLSTAYETDGPGLVACDEGQNIVYPETAPGYLYDPTRSRDKNPALSVSLASLKLSALHRCGKADAMSANTYQSD